jgi:hypothetical protein
VDVEVEKPHLPHRLGHRRLDLVMPIAALFISFVSIGIAWHHGRVMQELVHENERLVEANSLPYLEISTSNVAVDGQPELRLTVQNEGVGPARLADVLMTVNGKPVPDFNTLVDHCCERGLVKGAAKGSKQFRGFRSGELIQSTLRDRMIRPGESVDAFKWRVTPANQQIVDLLQEDFASNVVNTSICYCSVFNDCWTRTDDDRRPVAVQQCPVSSVPYRQ